jgi:hypothetical protein
MRFGEKFLGLCGQLTFRIVMVMQWVVGWILLLVSSHLQCSAKWGQLFDLRKFAVVTS